jgi:hypothetical protein
MSNIVSRFRLHIKKDPKWIKLRNMVKTAYNPKFDLYLEEMKALHKSRSSRLLSSDGTPTGKKVANAASKDMAVRSRCVEMCIEIAQIRNWLAIYMNTFQRYVEAEHTEWFKNNRVTTITAQRNIVQVLLGNAQQQLDKLDTVTEIADMIIKDCDQSGYGTKAVLDALAIATRREG